jgi:hypothetical protein
MKNLLIADWEPQGTSLPELTGPEVDLLWVVPLFDAEAEQVARTSGARVVSAIVVEDLRIEDRNRASLY